MTPRSHRLLSPLAALLLLVALLAAGASTKAFWEDEAFTTHTAQQPLDVILRTDRHVHPPLHYLVASAWVRFSGPSELAMRWLSIACAALAAALGYALARRWLGASVARTFIFLLALWPLFITYAHNARYYSWLVLLSMIALWCADSHARSGQVRWLIGFALAGAAMLYTAYASVIALAGCTLWWAMNVRRSAPIARPALGWLAANAAIALAFLPWQATFAYAVGQNVAVPGVAALAREFATRGALLGYSFLVGETTSPFNLAGWIGVAAIAVVTVWTLARRRVTAMAGRVLALLLFTALASVALAAASSNNPSPQNIGYRSLFFLPLLAMWVAYCLDRVPPLASRLAAVALISAFAVGLSNYYANREFLKPLMTVPWNAIMRQVQASSPDAALLCNRVDWACFYYGRAYGLDPRLPSDWPEVAARQPATVWWVNSNITTRAEAGFDAEFDLLRSLYGAPAQSDYAPQDPSVRMFKERFAGGDAYEYRVNAWRFGR